MMKNGPMNVDQKLMTETPGGKNLKLTLKKQRKLKNKNNDI